MNPVATRCFGSSQVWASAWVGSPFATAEDSPALQRDLGLFDIVVFGVGGIVGAGIYAIIGEAAAVGGNMPVSVGRYPVSAMAAIGGVLALLALNVAALAGVS